MKPLSRSSTAMRSEPDGEAASVAGVGAVGRDSVVPARTLSVIGRESRR